MEEEAVLNIFNGLNWNLFRDIEDKVVSSTKYVDLSNPSLEMFSREFANLLFQICTNIETTFKAMLHSPSLERDPRAKKVIEKEQKGFDLNISDYRDIFENFYHLSQCEVIVAPESYRIISKPFEDFREGKSPVWWHSYNGIKHDLSKNFDKATLKAVIDSLSGLFLLNVVHLDARNFLIENKILKQYDTEYQSTAGPFKAEKLKGKYSTLQHFDINVPD
jgi:hypothetical protein